MRSRVRLWLILLALLCPGILGCRGGGGSLDGSTSNPSSNGTSPPSITAQPSGLSVRIGQLATFSVLATGTGQLTYQWRRNGVNIPGANAPTLQFQTTDADNGVQFDVVVTNSA